MSEIPAWLAPVPDWLTAHVPQRERRSDALPPTKEGRALLFTQFETVFPRILDMMSAGYAVSKAVRELPPMHPPLDAGALMRWINADPKRKALFKEAKEYRTEVWADEMLRHAEGKDENGNETLADTSRSRLIVDTYWKLMGADNRKQYGDTKTIEMNTNISITAALAQAQGRLTAAQVFEDDVIEADYKQVGSGEIEDDD